jgi:hypothetical protein
MNPNDIIIPSTSADTTNHLYYQVLVNGTGPFSVNFNGQSMSLAGPNTFDLKVTSVSSGNANVFLIGKVKPLFPKYLGQAGGVSDEFYE